MANRWFPRPLGVRVSRDGTPSGVRPGLLSVWMRRMLVGLVFPAVALLVPSPASSQFGAVEALTSSVTHVSFFGGVGGLLPTRQAMNNHKNTYSFGVELLFEIASVERPVPGASVQTQRDSVQLKWSRMEVTRSEEGVDTVFFYDVEPAPPPPPTTEKIWSVELGIGYGQVTGFELADPTLQLRGSIRDLPSASVYASYEPWSTYFGIRTGFMRTKGMQVFDFDTRKTVSGDAEAFIAGALAGYAWSLGQFWFFTEAAYTIRHFPSVVWQGDTLEEGMPTDLQASGWSVSVGIQFPIR